MADINPTLPSVNELNSTADPKVLSALQTIVSTVNDLETANLADSAVTTAKIATGAVTAACLADTVTNAQTASYTLVLGDKNKIVEVSNASANTLTVPPNSSVAFPTGSQISVLQTGAGQTTVTAGSGVTINATPGLKCRAQWSSATLIKRATDTWVAVGDLAA